MARAGYTPPAVNPRKERERREKEAKYDTIREQIESGSLVVRQMSASERIKWGLAPLPVEVLTVEDVQRLWRLRKAQETRQQIADALGCHVNVVRNCVSRRGIYAGKEYDPA